MATEESSKSTATGMRLPTVIYVLALVSGLVLAVGFARFNSIHGEFLEANFDAVHGARTLLKARYYLAQVEDRLNAAVDDPGRRAQLVAQAIEAIDLAESYGVEGRDAEPKTRSELAARLRSVREGLGRPPPATAEAALRDAAQAIHRLSGDYEAAELDRWGTLSSLNSELARRMEQMRLFIAAIVVGFVVLMALLGWALLRARRSGLSLQQAIADAEAIQQTTLDASPVGIVYVDHVAGRILLANRQMAEIFGYPAEQLMAMRPAELFPDANSHVAFVRSIRGELERGVVPSNELQLRRSSGEIFWCALNGKGIAAAGMARRMVWTCEDISARKAAESELLAARAKAEAASQAKSDFLANMSHEIRTPFTGILGVLELLAHTSLSAQQERHVEVARQSARQLLAIVNDILDISRVEAGKLPIDPVDFEARHLFDEIARMHDAAARQKRLSFSYRFDAAGPTTVTGDPVRIRQIVDNLLGNAVKFTAQGGVDLRVRCTRPDDTARVCLRIDVIDSGIGIAAEKQVLIFDKFTQADATTTRQYGGTGLGLSICRQLAQLMAADIGVDSAPGRGSRFWIELDLPAAPPMPVADLADLGSLVPKLAGKRLLVADDDPLSREVLVESLAATDCSVRLAANGLEALELIADWQPDLILMDCQMPVMDGYTATQRIRRLELPGRRVPIIAITAHAMPGNRPKCLAVGMDDFLAKPISRRELFGRIAFWLLPDRESAAWPKFDGRLLLVDNDRGVREACRGMLEAMGCAVTVAASGAEALAEEGRSDFDLVLMDWHMPGIDGLETTRRWRDREREYGRPRTAIVAMTGSSSSDELRRYRDADMDDFLAKPFTSDALSALLSHWLAPRH